MINNNNNNNNTMNYNTDNNDNYSDNNYSRTMMNSSSDNSSGAPFAAAEVDTPALQQHQPVTSSSLYQLAARNLREHLGVQSMTALKLKKTLGLLGLPPRRVVKQGLAPRRLLKDDSSPLVLSGESSDEGQEEWRLAETGAQMMDTTEDDLTINDTDNNNNGSSEDEDEEEDEASSSTHDENGNNMTSIDNYISDDDDEDAKGDVQGLQADGNGNGKKRRPIHAALVAGGINIRPRETRRLLDALGVNPHRLVRLGLVERGAVRAMTGRRGGGPGQRPRAVGPGNRGVGGPRVGGPRGPPFGPPHADVGPHAHGRPSLGDGPRSRALHGPPGRPFRGAGHHSMHRGRESEEEGVSAPPGPHGGPGPGPHGGPGPRSPRRHGGRLQGPLNGPGPHSMPTIGRGRGPPGGGEHGHRHSRARHSRPPCEHGRGHGHDGGGGLHNESDGDGGELLHKAARGPGQHGPRRVGGSLAGPRGPPHGPPPAHAHGGPSPSCGPTRPMHGPPGSPFRGTGHHNMHLEEESEEEGMSALLGPHRRPGHCGPCQHGGGGGGGGGTGRSRGGHQGPVHGPVHGPFNGLFHEGVSGAPPGMMAHPHHDPPPRGGGGVEKRGGRHRGGTGVGGGGDMQHGRRRAHLAHFHGRHQPQLEAY